MKTFPWEGTYVNRQFTCYFVAGGNVVLLYASKYRDIHTVVNISGRFNLERGIEGRLGKEFLQRIKQKGFIDVKNRKGKPSNSSFCFNITEIPQNDKSS